VISSGGEGAPSDITTHSSKEGVKGGKKRHKQHLQGVTTTIGHDDDNDNEAAALA
jgi:hypothetical protein